MTLISCYLFITSLVPDCLPAAVLPLSFPPLLPQLQPSFSPLYLAFSSFPPACLARACMPRCAWPFSVEGRNIPKYWNGMPGKPSCLKCVHGIFLQGTKLASLYMYSIVNSAYCSMRGDSIEGRSVRMIADVIVRIHPLTLPSPTIIWKLFLGWNQL